MVYELIKKINGKNYLYLVHNVRTFSGKNKKITKYVGLAENFKKYDIEKLIKKIKFTLIKKS